MIDLEKEQETNLRRALTDFGYEYLERILHAARTEFESGDFQAILGMVRAENAARGELGLLRDSKTIGPSQDHIIRNPRP